MNLPRASWAVRSSASLWAISGKGTADKKGRELWWFTAGPGQTIGAPAVADVDGDGTPDLVAMFASPQGAVWIEAVNGKTGISLWRSPLEAAWFQGATESRWSPGIVHLDGRQVVVCIAGTRLVGLDLKSGAASWPAVDLGLEPVMPPRIADLDGDGQPDVVVLGIANSDKLNLLALSGKTRTPLWTKTLRSKQSNDNVYWESQLWGDRRIYKKLADWPWIVDLAGDHKPQVVIPIVPTANPAAPSRWGGVEVLDGATGQLRWKHELRVARQGLGIDQLIVGPDVNGDGHVDLFSATAVQNSRGQSIFVDAISGKDGRSLWYWQSEHSNFLSGAGGGGASSSGGFSSVNRDLTWPYMAPLRWWCSGPDGWPQLVVSDNSWGQPQTFILSSGTGRLMHKIADEINLLDVADLNQDGLPDLVYRKAMGTQLHAIRGRAPVAWQRLGDFRPAQDFDGDGIVDLLTNTQSGNSGSGMCAISGRDGRVLWRTQAISDSQGTVCPPGPLADLDGDGTPDILVVRKMGHYNSFEAKAGVVELPLDLQAVSGKTGNLLWNAESQLVATTVNGESVGWSPRTPVCVDLTGDGRPTVVVAYEIVSGSGGGHQAWMAAMSGRNGKAIWRVPVSEKMPMGVSELPNGCTFPFGLADINGDGVRDLVVVVPLRPTMGRPGFGDYLWSYELRALSGRDGALLWRRPLPIQVQSYFLEHAAAAPLFADLAGDGKKQLLTLFRTERLPDQTSRLVWQVQCCNPQTGEPLWNWEQPDTNYSSSLQQDPWLFLAELDGDGRRSVCASMFGAPDVVLDGRGQARTDIAGTIFASQDIDGDGKEETLFVHEGKLRVTRGSVTNVLWEWPDVESVREILPGKPAATVVVMTAQGLLGLDGATGRPLWRTPNDGGETILVDANNRERPRLVTLATDESRATVCRLGLAIASRGTLVVGGLQPEDPRIVRPLPWVEVLLRLRAVANADMGEPRGNVYMPLTLMIALTAVFVIQAAYLCCMRRWRQFKVLAAGLVLVTLAMAVMGMYNDSRGMNPIEHYSWSGWYWIAVFGMPLTGLFVVALHFLERLVWLIRRVVRRMSAQPAIA